MERESVSSSVPQATVASYATVSSSYIYNCLWLQSPVLSNTDIDECAGNDTVCDGNADCHDTDGSYWCECRPGFQGDGYNCTGT